MSWSAWRRNRSAAPARRTRWAGRGRRASLAGAIAAALLVGLPAAPAFAIQTIAWTTAPPASVTLGQPISFAWSGTANTFLGARITGCFANFPDAPNYTNTFGGNFTTGNCNYTNRIVTTSPTYTVVVGFNLSTGGQMTMSWNISVNAVSPTLNNVPSSLALTATSASGAAVPPWNVYGSDAVYGAYSATCTPSAGTVLPVGTTTGSCSATNPGGRTTTQSVPITVAKGTPSISWSPPGQISYGQPLASLLTAAMVPPDATGPISYAVNGTPVDGSTVLDPGNGQAITATYSPTGAAASSYTSVSIARSIDVIANAQSVGFDTVPTTATVGDPAFAVTATGTSGGGPVTITTAPGSECTVAPSSSGTSATAEVTVTGAGACVLLADQAAATGYTAAPQVQRSVTIARATPALSWAPPSQITYGTTLADLLDASTPVAGTYSYVLNSQPVTGATVPDAGSGQVLQVIFIPADLDDYTTATTSRSLTVGQAEQTLTVGPVADHVFGDEPFGLVVAGDGPGAVTTTADGACTVDDLQVTIVAAGDCTITVAKADTANYLPTEAVTRTFSTAKGTVDLQWAAPATISYGTVLTGAQLDAAAVAAAGDPTGQIDYTLDDGTPALGAFLHVGDHTLHAQWSAVGGSSGNWEDATAAVQLHVLSADFTSGALATITGTPRVGQPLTASTGDTVPAADSYSYRWFADGQQVAGATTSTFTPTVREGGKAISVEVTATKTDYVDSVSLSDPTSPVSGGSIAVPAPVIGGTVAGTPVVDGTLSASLPAGLDPADASVDFSWSRNGSVVGTGVSYTPTPSDVGQPLTVTVTAGKAFLDDATSTASTAAVVKAHFATGPTAGISGTVKVGQTLTAAAGSPTPTPDGYQYQWYADGTPISGADHATYALTSAQTHARVSVKVTAVRAGYTAASNTSAPTSQVATNLAPTVHLGVDRAKLRRGQSARLTWTSAEATRLTANGGWTGRKSAAGSATVKPTALGATTYVLRAGNDNGTTTAQVTVQVTRPATVLKVTASKGLHLVGTRIRVTATGLDSGETYTVRIAGTRVATGTATRAGQVDRTVTIPTGLKQGAAMVTVTGSTADRAGAVTVRVVTPRRLGLTLAHHDVRASDTQRYTVRGLAAGEKVTVSYQGKRVSPKAARADRHGTYTGTFGVGMYWGTKFVTVKGQFVGRTASQTFQVVQRCTTGHICR
ncbi:hypothetical protein [Angustibacter luteus]|uniref:Ig-like domain-containing protein n=1 Tax=Angustibacter luteus TaxID=658456 RepID=A0ABW1JHN3_9ACTN